MLPGGEYFVGAFMALLWLVASAALGVGTGVLLSLIYKNCVLDKSELRRLKDQGHRMKPLPWWLRDEFTLGLLVTLSILAWLYGFAGPVYALWRFISKAMTGGC